MEGLYPFASNRANSNLFRRARVQRACIDEQFATCRPLDTRSTLTERETTCFF